MSNFPPSSGLDAAAFVRVAARFVAHLQKNEARLNDLNVFPVPDGDTGTNSLLTASAGFEKIADSQLSLADTALAFANGCAFGARGNSGVILSEYLRGLAIGLAQDGSWNFALSLGARFARECVGDPQEGTILSVADAIANGVYATTDFSQMVTQAATNARSALLETTFQLPVLEEAGVVDSGAMVLCLFHDAVAQEVAGVELPALEVAMPTCSIVTADYVGPEFELMFRFAGPIEALRAQLADMGDSLAIAGDEPHQVHIHVDEPTKVIALANDLGRVSRVVVTSLVAAPTNREAVSAVVVVTPGDQLSELIEQAGASAVVVAPNTNPSTNDLVTAALRTNKSDVILLPSDSDVFAAAQLATSILSEQGMHLYVVPTRSTVASIAALAVWQESATAVENVAPMEQAANAVRSGAVTYAARNANTPIGPCSVGDVLGLVDGQVVVIDSERNDLACAFLVIDELVQDTVELVTVITGAGVANLADLEKSLRSRHPDVEFVVLAGGQPLWPFLIGAE